jgi:hypothetical protein
VIKKVAILCLILLIAHTFAGAQCSMCKAVAESGSAGKDMQSMGQQLNYGILYLMAIPYLILFFLFRKKIFSFFSEMKSIYKK